MPKGEEQLTFERWLSLPENRAAQAAVEGVAAALRGCSERLPNPLFLHGPPGSGKTHLITALVQRVAQLVPDATLSVLGAGDFEALSRPREPSGAEGGAARLAAPTRPSGAENGAARLAAPTSDAHEELAAARQADLLVIEDVQRLSVRAVEAFLQLFDRRRARGQAMVLTANIGPAQLSHLPSRLTSRLAQGLVVGLETLAPRSRLAFLRDRAQRRGLDLDETVLTWMAEHMAGSARELEGILHRIETLARLHGSTPGREQVADWLRIEVEVHQPTLERITQRVGNYFRVEPRQMQSRQRSRNALLPRQVGMYLARQLTGLSLQQIGAYFGGRDHTTVLHACRKVEQALERDLTLSGAVRQLHADLA